MASGLSEPLPTSPITNGDQHLFQKFYPPIVGGIVHTISTTQFLKPSAESYPVHWLAREVAQNFVDHNVSARGTLNGVSIEENKTGDNSTIRIKGDWPFKDYTGLTAPHSEKFQGPDHQNAGGNGIGLKQVALRYLRDLGVSEFNVHGEGWEVKYKIIKASDFNADIARQGITAQRLKHDWLVAEVHPSSNKGRCIYEIKTINPDVQDSLKNLHEIAVSNDNSYLQNPSFSNKHGSWSWQQSTGDTRLFMNGQVFAYDSNQKTTWPGPECLTLNLTNVEYRMSIDRPALDKWSLLRHSEKIISSLSQADLVRQLKDSAFLWTGPEAQCPSYEMPFGLRFLEKLVDRLKSNKYLAKNLSSDFPDKKFVTYSNDLKPKQIQEVLEAGYTICPEFFSKLGLPEARSLFTDPNTGKENLPNSYQVERGLKELACKAGIQVHTTALNLTSINAASREIQKKLGKWISAISIDDTTIKISFADLKFSEEMLSHPLINPRKPEQQALSFIRSLILEGLQQHWLEHAFLSADGQKVTFDKTYDSMAEAVSLLSRITPSSKDGKTILELKRTAHSSSWNQDLFLPPVDSEGQGQNSTSSSPLTNPLEVEKPSSNFGKYAFWTSTVAVIATIGWLASSLKLELPSGIFAGNPKEPTSTKVNPHNHSENPLAPYQSLLGEAESLIKKAESHTNQDPSDQEIYKQYQEWKMGTQIPTLPKTPPNYLNNTISGVIGEMNSAAINPVSEVQSLEQQELVRKLQNIIEQVAGQQDKVDNFQIIPKLTEVEELKITYLRDFFAISTGIEVKNNFFVFTGEGAKGINISKESIGLHQALLDTSFEEALSTFIHEVAHNYASNHGNEFIDATESLNAKVHEYLQGMALRATLGNLTEADKALQQIRFNWYQDNK